MSILGLYSNDLSSNPTEVYNFSEKLVLNETKINKKRVWLAILKNIGVPGRWSCGYGLACPRGREFES